MFSTVLDTIFYQDSTSFSNYILKNMNLHENLQSSHSQMTEYYINA